MRSQKDVSAISVLHHVRIACNAPMPVTGVLHPAINQQRGIGIQQMPDLSAVTSALLFYRVSPNSGEGRNDGVLHEALYAQINLLLTFY